MARDVFRKYKALFPEKESKPFTRPNNAIEAIYNLLNQQVKSADIIEVMLQLQSVVDENVNLKEGNNPEGVYIDLSKFDIEKLKSAFAKTPRKNTLTYDLQQIIERKLEQMLKENPLRLEFYERYKEIIHEYNQGKSQENTVRAFEKLAEFVKDLSQEEKRAITENLSNQETLAIFDLLREGKELDSKDIKVVKKVAVETLENLKAEKLKIERWRESRQITSQVKLMIYDHLLNLPEQSYSDEDVSLKTVSVYQHIYSNYYGEGRSVYGMRA